jgi:hypothetical protein
MAVAAAVVLLLAGPLLLVSTLAADEPVVASNHGNDRLMFIAGHTMLLEQGSVGRQIADWLKMGAADTRAFEIGDQAFSPNSVELTPGGWSHLVHFAQIMKGHPALKAHILVSAQTTDVALRRLEETRAKRLRDGIVAQGVAQSRVTALDDSAEISSAQAHAPADGSSQLLVLLSKEA